MVWGPITAADVEGHLNAGELADYRKHSAEIADPLPVIIADVISLVRGFVGARYPLPQPGVPPSLRLPAIDMIIHQLAKRVRSSGEADEARRAAAERAHDILNKVSAGTLALGEMDDGCDAPKGGSWGSETRFNSPPR